MQEQTNKLKTYLGFSIKSNSILFGYDNITKSRKKLDLIIFCSTAQEKIIKPILKLNFKCVKLKELKLSELLERENVKVIAIKNYNLAKAILAYNDLFEELN